MTQTSDRARLSALILVALSASACASSPRAPEVPAATREAYAEHLVPEAECRAASPEQIDQRAMQEDVQVLSRLLARGYAGYADVQDEDGWRTLFDGLSRESPESSTVPEFRDRLARALAVVDDNHVGLWTFEPRRTYRGTSGHAQAYASPASEGEGDSFVDAEGRALVCRAPSAVRDAQLEQSVNGGVLRRQWIALSRTPLSEFVCTADDGTEVMLPAQRVDLAHGRGPAFERMQTGYPWVRLRSLMTTHADALEQFVASAERDREAPVVVVDLRHSGGGSDRYLRNYFAQYAHEPLDYWQTGTLKSETMLQGARNFWGCVRAASRSRDAGGRAWLDARIRRADRELDEAMVARGPFHEIIRREMPVEPRASTPFAGRMIVVVGRGCQSACETSVVLARQIPGVVIVGENTGGVMKVGELRWYRMPHSQIWISLGHRSHGDPEGLFREAQGFQPDLWLTDGETDASIRALAECLSDEACAAEFDRARGSE